MRSETTVKRRGTHSVLGVPDCGDYHTRRYRRRANIRHFNRNQPGGTADSAPSDASGAESVARARRYPLSASVSCHNTPEVRRPLRLAGRGRASSRFHPPGEPIPAARVKSVFFHVIRGTGPSMIRLDPSVVDVPPSRRTRRKWHNAASSLPLCFGLRWRPCSIFRAVTKQSVGQRVIAFAGDMIVDSRSMDIDLLGGDLVPEADSFQPGFPRIPPRCRSGPWSCSLVLPPALTAETNEIHERPASSAQLLFDLLNSVCIHRPCRAIRMPPSARRFP